MTSNQREIAWIRQSDNSAAFVFLHGFGGDTTKTWNRFPSLLTEDDAFDGWDVVCIGYTSKLVPDFLRGIWTADADLTNLGRLLATTLEDTAFAGYERLVLIGHSMGGLVIQQALVSSEAVAKRTERMFCFGTPSRGLRNAKRFFWVKQQIGDMATGSEFLTKLRAQWTDEIEAKSLFPFHLVAAERDQFVPPESSLEGFDEGVCEVIPGDHLSLVKPETRDSPCYTFVRARLLDGTFERGPLDSARLAVQRGRFQDVVELLGSAASAGELKADDAVDYAIALCGLDRSDDAIAFLEGLPEPSTDVMGTLAGRLKRTFVYEHRASFGERALAMYEDAYARAKDAGPHHEQCHYHAVNIAFMSFVLADRTDPNRMETPREWARTALEHADQAKDAWRHASRAEALLYLGEDFGFCLEAYSDALETLEHAWQVRSMYFQARVYLEEVGAHDDLAALEKLLEGSLEERAG